MRRVVVLLALLAGACTYRVGEPKRACVVVETRRVPFVSGSGDTVWVAVTGRFPCDTSSAH